MGLTSAQLTAAILSFVSSFLITQVIGRLIEHNYDKLFKELDKNLKIKNALPDDMKSASLDQIVRQQLNAYILQRSQESVGKQVMNRMRLTLLAGLSATAFAFTVYLAIDGHPVWAGVTFLVTLSFGSYYLDRRKAWTRRGIVENTKYRAVLIGGTYSGGETMINILQDPNDDASNIALDYPRLAVVDDAHNKLHVYKRIHSEGAVNIASGDDTSLSTQYEYEGTTPLNESTPTHSSKQALVTPPDIRTSGVYYPQTAEMPLITRPIQDAVGIGKKVVRLSQSLTRRI